MPLWLLATIVVTGLAAIWLAMRLFGFARSLTLDEAAARAEWAAQNPFVEARDITLSSDGKAALVATARGPHLLWVMGLDTAVHPLAGATATTWPDGLVFVFNDFAAPRVRVALSPAEVREWQTVIGRMA